MRRHLQLKPGLVLSFAVAVACVATQAHAAEGYVSGLGKQTCSAVQQSLNDKTLSTDALQQWVSGYFSGANVAYSARSKIGDITTGSTVFPERLLALVQDACKAKPEETLGRVTYETYFQLRQANQ